MHFLLPAGSPDPLEETALFRAYAAPRPDWVRANFVASADGSATLGGTAAGLGSPADQQVLAVLRAHADVVLVGAGTVRDEAYGPLTHSAERTALRRAAGRIDVARLAVVTRAASFDGTERWIREAPVPPLILTTTAGLRDVAGAEVVACGNEWVENDPMLAALAERGLRHVLTEGGPTLFATLAGSGRLDELCLTLSPILVGPGTTRIVNGAAWREAQRGTLTQLLEDDGLLFARYRFSANG